MLLYEFSWTRIISVGLNPAIEALFETKDNCEAHDEEGNTPTNGPEVALRLGPYWRSLEDSSRSTTLGFRSQPEFLGTISMYKT